MRPDFNKLLTERERLNHKAKFHDVRGAKRNKTFDEDAKGGKESIHQRRRNSVKVSRKRFNENLNPLKDFLRTNAGRPWDKVYSEICSTFDKRKVINNHILEHLFQYVATKDVFVVEGKVFERSYWRNEGRPINESYSDYYVDPRDGILKATRKQPKVSLKKLKETERAKQIDAVFKVIDKNTHLILEDGIWWLLDIKDIPEAVRIWSPPSNMSEREFARLSKDEQKLCGRWVWERPRYDAVSNGVRGFRNVDAGPGRYYASRQQANAKVLKAMGVSGLTEFDEVARMSHREASKYRVKSH